MLANRIDRVNIRNYRSLGDVTVDLEDLTVFIGENGSGKSNFLDVLRFVRDALQHGLDAALISYDRGGIGALRRYSAKGKPYDVAISLDLTLNNEKCSYSFTLSSLRRNEYRVKSERCSVASGKYTYEIKDGKLVETTIDGAIAIQEKNLTLPLVGNLTEFSLLYEFLIQMGFYSIFPNNLRPPQRPGNTYPLDEQGNNLATVLRDFVKRPENDRKENLFEDLATVVPGITRNDPIDVRQVGSYLVVRIKHENDTGIFDLALESDGTIRTLGILTAIYQYPTLPLLSIEEPELMIHARAMGLLCDVLLEASRRGQILITTHSPDLIARFSAEAFRIVERTNGTTQIGILTYDQRQSIAQKIFNAGDLLRIEGLKRG